MVDCPLGTTSVAAHCRKLKGGIEQAQKKAEMAAQKMEKKLLRELKAGVKRAGKESKKLLRAASAMKRGRGRGANGPSKKRARME